MVTLHDPARPDHPMDYRRRAVKHNGVWHILPRFQLIQVSQEFHTKEQYHCFCGRQFFAKKDEQLVAEVLKSGEPICSACHKLYVLKPGRRDVQIYQKHK